MIPQHLDAFIDESAAHTTSLFHELKELERRKHIDPELLTILYVARETMRFQNHALRALSRGLTDLDAKLAEFR